jgi:N6-L-threonylcarbamoyladenine synthase
LYSPWIRGDPPRADFHDFEPHLALVVSGGHTLLVRVDRLLQHRRLGGTIDDAAGECFDKIAKMMGLPYPGGPTLDRLAAEGSPTAFDFPRPLLKERTDDFSFSGLKTAVRYRLRDHPHLLEDPLQLRNVCASVQAAIVDVLVAKTIRAVLRERLGCVTASGGVTRNRRLRQELATACARHQLRLRVAEEDFCTDNAGMIGILAGVQYQYGLPSNSLDEEVLPGWALTEATHP